MFWHARFAASPLFSTTDPKLRMTETSVSSHDDFDFLHQPAKLRMPVKSIFLTAALPKHATYGSVKATTLLALNVLFLQVTYYSQRGSMCGYNTLCSKGNLFFLFSVSFQEMQGAWSLCS